MSQRAKRPNRTEDASVPAKRRKRTPAEEEEAATLAAAQAAQGPWQPRASDLKTIYNRTTTEAPAELFRKDLISAMKLPDSEPLALDEYWVIVDQWKQEWERGVQVPVNPDSLPEPSTSVMETRPYKVNKEFRLPKNKYIRITKDDTFDSEIHAFSNAPAQSEAACSYDLDECDVAWLKILNAERAACGQGPVHEDQLERVIERLELCCWEKIQSILRNEEGLGIEYDENVICDVCRSPDSEDGNEMVFCDSCNICVHQACYGITKIPEGQWLCCTCNIGKRPDCMLCPNKGGAMKSTRTGHKWAHVSCALWIPEVSIGCVEKMEPITKISSIPSSRWALICVLCRERRGACIQCSVKTCKTAYHVTCAFKHGLEMRAIIEDENADDGVKLRSYCEKHSKSGKKSEKSVCSGGSEEDDTKRKKRKDMTNEEKNQARAARLQEIESEFFKHVALKDVNMHIEVDQDGLQYIYNYWKLKRKAGNNKPLLPPKSEDIDVLSHKREQADLEKMKMFVQLRQDLERVRNLCYMVSRREKLSRSFFRMREQTFHKQAAVLSTSNTLPSTVIQAVIEANHGPSIYDRLYSHNEAEDHTSDFDILLARIAGLKSPSHSGDEHKMELNGFLRDVKNNPYKKVYFNGSSKRRSASLYGSGLSSASSSDEKPKDNKENRIQSSSEDNKPQINKKKAPSSAPRRIAAKKKLITSRIKVESSSEDDEKPPLLLAKEPSRSRLGQVANELGDTESESDELLPIKSSRKSNDNQKKINSIYSDSDTSDASMKNDDKSSNATNDSQSKLRTKAAVKEFSNKPSSSNKQQEQVKKKIKLEENKKKDYVPSDLIVPQRQAAKKASENLKLTNRSKDPHPQEEQTIKPEPEKDTKPTKPKGKVSQKPEIKDKKASEAEMQELLAFVPQRQAAKKAAEHIKSGMTKPTATANPEVTEVPNKTEPVKAKKDIETNNKSKTESSPVKPPAKIQETKRKSSVVHSSSSSSSSTSSSSDSSSSSSESEREEKTKPQSESQVSSGEAAKRSSNAKQDWPFLDKGARPAASSSSSASDSSDSSAPSTPRAQSPARKPSPVAVRKPSPAPATKKSPRKPSPVNARRRSSPVNARRKSSPISARRKSSPVSSRRKSSSSPTKTEPTNNVKRGRKSSSDKKLSQTPPKREEPPARRGRGRGRPSRNSQSSSDRIGEANARPRDLFNDKRVSMEDEPAKRKDTGSSPRAGDRHNKETQESNVFSSVNKQDKKLKENTPEPKEITPEPRKIDLEREIRERKADKEKVGIKTSKSNLDKKIDLEREIRERKADKEKDGIKTSKSTLDRLFLTNRKFNDHNLEKEQQLKTIDKIYQNIKNHSREGSENNEPSKPDSMIIKSPNKELKEQIEKKFETIPTNKKSPTKSRSIEEPNSDTKENITQQIKSTKISEEISTADKIVDDHLQSQKLHELNNEANLVYNMNEYDHETTNATKSLEDLQPKMLFSPPSQTKETDILDLVNFDDNFGLKDEIMLKDHNNIQFPAFNNPPIKEDTKEDSARETLNLVEKLRMGMTIKKSSDDATTSSLESDKGETNMEQVVPETTTAELFNQHHFSNNHIAKDFAKISANNENQDNSNKIYLQQPQELIHAAPMDGDERWVPPSNQNYPNMQQADNFINDPHFMPPAAMIDPRISQTPMSMDGLPCPSPYPDIHPQAKWADSAVMPSRRSSSSSSSSSSTSSKRDDEDIINKMPPAVSVVGNHTSYMPPPYNPTPLDSFGSQFPDPSFVPVSLFPPPNINTQISFAPTSSGVFPPPFGAPFPTPPMSKPLEDSIPYSAAFTSSQHNMALTAAMVNIPTPTPMVEEPVVKMPEPVMKMPELAMKMPELAMEKPEPVMEMPKPTMPEPGMKMTEAAMKMTEPTMKMAEPAAKVPDPVVSVMETPAPLAPSQQAVEDVLPSPVLSNEATPTNSTLPSPSMSVKNLAGKKSPSKPTRTSARVTSQMMNKSPAKSPGKSPRQEISQKPGPGRGRGEGKRGANKSGVAKNQATSRGRGRGKGRARGAVHHNDYDFMMGANTINKLVGTVYDLDFDDDISNDNMADLKSMRERRRSIDIHEKKYDSFSSPRSPKFSSPKNRFNADLRDLKPPSPIEDSKPTITNNSAAFPDVTPVLPGPVDMRTYSSSFDQPSYNEHNLLNAFASGTAGARVNEELDEDFEKELHTALASKKIEELQVPSAMASNNSSNIKVSLSDSRNQLKVKIKGPIANYTSTVAPLPPPIIETNISNISSNNTVISNITPSGGTSSLRRMRKKELLRQYWTQDMNMDDPSSNSSFIATPTITPTMNRTIITIPKAVASMTSIPTKDDYRDYRTDEFIENKHLKKSRGLARELKQLDLSMDDLSDRRRCSVVNNADTNKHKSRGRPARQTAPKLKIKIGTTNSVVAEEKIVEEKNLRPPKKRLTGVISKPSVEDLKRDSMKFRKQVMADLKVKKKKDKHKKKSKKSDSSAQVRIISDETSSTKLIIRFGKLKSASEVRTSNISDINDRTKNPNEPASVKKDEEEPPKLTPIKLKISRRGEGGGGYFTKPSQEDQSSQPGQPPPPRETTKEPPPPQQQQPAEPDPLEGFPDALQQAPPPLPLNKDCEVR